MTTSLIGKKQINYVATKLCRAIAILNKVKHKFDIKTLILLCNSFFYSHLNYCVHIWGNTFVSSLLKITIIQKRALKCILGRGGVGVMADAGVVAVLINAEMVLDMIKSSIYNI